MKRAHILIPKLDLALLLIHKCASSSLVRAAALLGHKRIAAPLDVTGAPVGATLCYDLYVSLFLYSRFRRFTAFHVSEFLCAGLFRLGFLLAKVGF